MTRAHLPYGRQTIDDDDIAAVTAALRSDYLTTGPRVAEFEAAFAAYTGATHAVACGTGTAALHLAALALDLGPGDKVIAPTLSFLASANGPHYTGAEVIFADCDGTGLMTPEIVKQALASAGDGVKAVIVVHLNGQPVEMEKIRAITKSHGVALIEDACHAIGSRYRSSDGAWHNIGACDHSDMACFSLHPVKTITMGEGGLVTTNNAEFDARMRRFRTHGMVREPQLFKNREFGFSSDGKPNPWYYEMPEVGFNHRASDINCALGLSQLAKMPRFAERRKAITARYDELFAGFPEWARPVAMRDDVDPVLHLYVMAIDFEGRCPKTRARVMQELSENGVGTQVHYLPVHLQPYYSGRYGRHELPGAEAYYRQALSIPLFPTMDDADVEHVVKTIGDVIGI